MKRLVLLLCIFGIGLLTTASYASETRRHDLIFKLTLTNNSKETLAYTGATDKNSGNIFLLSNDRITPGATITVIGVTTPESDLAGNLHFKDKEGDNIFMILVDRQFHCETPVLSVLNLKYTSHIISKTFDQYIDPHSLGYTAASVRIENS
jgi:hypothetical protein